MKSTDTYIEVMIHHQTDAAVLVSVDGTRESAVWLPKSQVAFEEEPTAGKAQIVMMPQRLAETKGLV